jgi:DNA (cytosine-5)-methyltransferase 1
VQDAGSDARGLHEVRPHRAAAEVIDWSDLGTSIFDRRRPLADKTLRRIVEGVRRFVLEDPAPFVLRVTHGEGGGWHVAPASEPLRTQTTRQDLAVATPVVQVIRGDVSGRHAERPLPTITAGNGPGRGAGAAHAMGIATPILATTGYGERDGQAARAHRVADLLGTAVDGVKQAVVSPVVVPCGGPKRQPSPASDILNTVLTREDRGVATPILVGAGGSGYAAKPVPADRRAVVAPLLSYYRHGGGQHSDLRGPMLTPTAQGTHATLVAALFVKFYGSGGQWGRAGDPLGTVTTIDRHGLAVCELAGEPFVIVDILFRMLRPHELAAAMGFRPDYVWPKSQRDAVRLIGNAVAPPMARALVGAVLPNGRPSGREVAA